MEKQNKIKDFAVKNKKIIIIGIIAAIAIYGFFATTPREKITDVVAPPGHLGEAERVRAEIEALRKSLEELRGGAVQQPQPQPQPIEPNVRSVEELQRALGIAQEGRQQDADAPVFNEQPVHVPPPPPPPPRIIKIDISAVPVQVGAAQIAETKTEVGKDDIYLPPGSFASFTLTSGAFAPETGELMPVSAVIDRAFVGPNRTTIPLRGCFFVGQARGVVVEKIANIKPVKIACVWPDGRTFEADIAGYVTSMEGRFGLPGEARRHTGEFFRTVGLASFFEGFGTGMVRARQRQEAVAAGQAVVETINVIGDAVEFAGWKGVAGLAGAAKSFFEAQARAITPSVDVAPGTRGYVFITTGVRIKGGMNNVNHQTYPYVRSISSLK